MEASLVLAWGYAERAVKVAVEVALVGEAGAGRGRGDRLAGLEEAPGGADAVSEVEGVRREADVLSEEADESELADAGRPGELVESDVSLRVVSEVIAGRAERTLVAGAEH
jgi:hypothetical protein